MKKLSKIKMLTIASLSATALAVPIVLGQNAGVAQDNGQTVNEQAHKDWGHRRGRAWGKRGMHGAIFRNINLTEDQKAKIKQISDSFRERTQPLRQELRAKRQELRQASAGGTFNEALATQKLQETAGLQAKLMGERFKLRQEFESVLTPEQKAQIEKQKAEFKARRDRQVKPAGE